MGDSCPPVSSWSAGRAQSKPTAIATNRFTWPLSRFGSAAAPVGKPRVCDESTGSSAQARREEGEDHQGKDLDITCKTYQTRLEATRMLIRDEGSRAISQQQRHEANVGQLAVC